MLGLVCAQVSTSANPRRQKNPNKRRGEQQEEREGRERSETAWDGLDVPILICV